MTSIKESLINHQLCLITNQLYGICRGEKNACRQYYIYLNDLDIIELTLQSYTAYTPCGAVHNIKHDKLQGPHFIYKHLVTLQQI